MKFNFTLLKSFLFCALFLLAIRLDATDLDKFDSIINKSTSFKNKNYDSLVFYAQQAYDHADVMNDQNKKLDALFILIAGKIRTGNLISALELRDKALDIYNTHLLIDREPEILLYIGLIYSSMEMSAEALESFLKALDKTKSYTDQRTDIYYYIANTYHSLNELDKCREYINLSLNTPLCESSDKDRVPSLLLYSGVHDNLDSIQKYLGMAELILIKYPTLLYEKVAVLGTRAQINNHLNNYKESKVQYIEAINISKTNGFRKFLSTLYNNYAYLLMDELIYDSAGFYLQKALDIAIDIEDIDMESSVYDSYSEYYEIIGDYKNALLYSNLYIEKHKQFKQGQKIQKSLFLTALFETEQKEKQLLEKENKINRQGFYLFGIIAILAIALGIIVYFIQKSLLNKTRFEAMEKSKSLDVANAIIQGQDKERKRIAMDLHDGMGARLGALKFEFEGFFKSHPKHSDISNSISEIHQNIRNLSHRMSPPELERLGLQEAVKNLISSISNSDQFTIEFETNLETRLPDIMETNIYFLIFELINNATRHSKGNIIFVQLLKQDNNKINLSVEDNGGGFVHNKDNEGMGLKNIRLRVDYLGGKLNIESNDYDTLFMIEIPIEKND